MPAKMTKAQARAWKRRWKLINEYQKQELRRTPIEVKFRQTAELMASARALGWKVRTDKERAEVRRRWKRLRKAYGV